MSDQLKSAQPISEKAVELAEQALPIFWNESLRGAAKELLAQMFEEQMRAKALQARLDEALGILRRWVGTNGPYQHAQYDARAFLAKQEIVGG